MTTLYNFGRRVGGGRSTGEGLNMILIRERGVADITGISFWINLPSLAPFQASQRTLTSTKLHG